MVEVPEYEQALGLSSEFTGGRVDNFHVSIATLAIGSGPQMTLPAQGITLVVGGNNTGKSTLLKQIAAELVKGSEAVVESKARVLSKMTLRKRGKMKDVYAWLGAHTQLVLAGSPGFARADHSAPTGLIERSWEYDSRLWYLGRFFSTLANARERFKWTAPAEKRSDIGLNPVHPLHFLEDDPSLLRELNDFAVEIFGEGLTLDRLSGTVMLRLGTTTMPAPPVDAVSSEYRAELASLLPLEKQGDGMASTLGLLLPLVASTYPIVLVDEPEAFLHPPQAFKLGVALAKLSASRSCQIILATHDRNIVTGVLSQAKGETTVLRLERSGSASSCSQISADQLKELWSSPSLRYSNVLDGLFHQAVVIAEHERDCRFYSAVVDANSRKAIISASDIMFSPSHGNAGVPEVAEVLQSAAVPVVASLDLDTLSDKNLLKKIVKAVGGTWHSELDSKYDSATAEFRTPRRPQTHADVARTVNAILIEQPDAVYDRTAQKKVQVQLATDSPWRSLKDFGFRAFKADVPAAQQLLELLDKEGVVLAKVGELEGFGPALATKKGAGWVPAAIAADVHRSLEATQHAERLEASILQRMRAQLAA